MKKLLTAAAFALATCLAIPAFAQAPAEPAVAQVAPVNLNTADAATLSERLAGVGAAKARAIVEHREARGPFTQVDDLLEVKGIGPAILEKNRAVLSVE